MNISVDATALNTVLYALSTIAQTCAALAALVGALALYRMQTMRDDHATNEQRLRDLITPGLGRTAALDEVLRSARAQAGDRSGLSAGLVARLRMAMAEWDAFGPRYERAVRTFTVFEAWNLTVILASLLGFGCASWLASRWTVFTVGLIVCSIGTVVVTGGALYVMARRNVGAA